MDLSTRCPLPTPCPAVVDEARAHPTPARTVNSALHPGTPPVEVTTVIPAGMRWERITATVLALLFDLTQQAARFGCGTSPWVQLAVYDADGFASFTAGASA